MTCLIAKSIVHRFSLSSKSVGSPPYVVNADSAYWNPGLDYKSTWFVDHGFLQAAPGSVEFSRGILSSSLSVHFSHIYPFRHTIQWAGKTSTRSSKISSCWESACLISPFHWNPSEYLTRLFYFPYSLTAARAPRTISERRITHIVSVCTDPIPADVPAGGIKQLRLPIPDVEYVDLLIHLPAACRFIHQALAEGGVVLVHSDQGRSRAAAVVAAYVSASTSPIALYIEC